MEMIHNVLVHEHIDHRFLFSQYMNHNFRVNQLIDHNFLIHQQMKCNFLFIIFCINCIYCFSIIDICVQHSFNIAVMSFLRIKGLYCALQNVLRQSIYNINSNTIHNHPCLLLLLCVSFCTWCIMNFWYLHIQNEIESFDCFEYYECLITINAMNTLNALNLN